MKTKLKKLTFFISLILILVSSSCFFVGCDSYVPSPDEKAVNRVMARNARMLAKKYHMCPCADTVAMPGGDIRYLALEFKICGPLCKGELRKILIDAVHDFLIDINSDSELCSYLKNHSLTIKDIGIILFLIDSSGRDLDDPNIGIAGISKGELEYDTLISTYDDEFKMDIPSFKSKHKESYQEALHIIKTQQSYCED